MASWVLWSWGNFTENTSQRKLLLIPEFFLSGMNCSPPGTCCSQFWKFPRISSDFNFIGSSNSPYLTLLLGLMLWSPWQPPALVSLLSCHKGVLGCGLILLCTSMCFPVLIGFVTQENSARASEKRGTCSSHVARVSRPFFPTKEEKKKEKLAWRNHKPVNSELHEKEDFRGEWTNALTTACSFFQHGREVFL